MKCEIISRRWHTMKNVSRLILSITQLTTTLPLCINVLTEQTRLLNGIEKPYRLILATAMHIIIWETFTKTCITMKKPLNVIKKQSNICQLTLLPLQIWESVISK